MTHPTFTIPDPFALPDAVVTAKGTLAQTQLTTTDNLAHVLNELGITLRYNMMERRLVFVHPAFDNTPLSQDKARLLVIDMLTRLRIKNVALIDEMLLVLSRDDRFHPMADWIPDEWDGVDRFEALLASVPTQSPMWRTYLRKWLIEVCEAVLGWESGVPRSLPNVLCFVGDQGIGKGRWLRSLAPPEFVMADAELHLGSNQGKDHQIQALRHPIVELGEIDSTFRKADVSALKAFLSRQTDEIREPYARTASRHLRCTVFFGTVNDVEFLNDGTGTRRYWPVQVDGPIQWDHGLDMAQLWAQAATWWENPEEDWFLSAEEDAARVADSEGHTMTPPVVDLVAGHLRDYGDNWEDYVLANKTELLQLCGVAHPTMAQVADVTRWMTQNRGKPRKLKGKQRCWPVPAGPRYISVGKYQRISVNYAKQACRWDLSEDAE